MIQLNAFHIYHAVYGLPEFASVSEALRKQMERTKLKPFENLFHIADELNNEQINHAIHFKESYVSIDQLIEFGETSSLPIITFKSTANQLQPYLILHHQQEVNEINLATGVSNVYEVKDYNYEAFYVSGTSANCITITPFGSAYARLVQESPNASTFKKLFSILKMDKKDIFNLFFYATLGGIVGLAIPLGIQSLINFLQTGQVTASGIILIVFIILAVMFSGILQIIQLWLMEILQQRLFAKVALDFVYRLPKLSFEKNKHLFGPEVMNRFFDIVSLQKGLSSVLIDLTASILQVVFGLLILSFYHPIFIAFSGVLIIAIYLILRFTGNKGLEYSLKESKVKYLTASWLQTVARSRFSFQMAEANNLHSRRMDSLVGEYIMARKKHFKVLVTQYLAFVFFSVLITGGLLIIGYYLLLSEAITLGQFVAAEIIILLIVNAVEKSILKIESVYDILTSVEKITQVAALPLEESKNGISFQKQETITLQLDRLKIGKTMVNLTANSGAFYQLNVNNQLEKDELVDILSKVISVYEGTVSINQIDYELIDKSFITKKIAFSTEQELLFDGTILENISMGHYDVDEHQVRQLFTELNAIEFINRFPDGFNTEIVGGHYADQHELYHFCLLARMILKRPAVMVYDTALLPQSVRKHVETYLKSRPNNSIVIALHTND
jgi:ABC-type bacteriocin/lantibiotic exporter with double-glycine peptidase domain